ncbi:hypothetical protein Tco_1025447 [Tanacetum coccineum]
MNSLSKRYEKIRSIPKELRIPSALTAPIQNKHQSLPEGVPFVNNMVIEEPEYEIKCLTDQDSRKRKIQSEAKEKLIADHPDQEKLQSKRVK